MLQTSTKQEKWATKYNLIDFRTKKNDFLYNDHLVRVDNKKIFYNSSICCFIVYIVSESVWITNALCSISSFLWRRYSQWKNEIKQMTKITESTAKIYTGTK